MLVPGTGIVAVAQQPLNKLLKNLNGSLKVSVKEFNGTDLLTEHIFHKNFLQTKTGSWALQLKTTSPPGQGDVIEAVASFRLNSGVAKSTAVSVSFDFSKWNPKNYVLVPAAVYNGNRYRSIGNGYNPDYPKDM